MGVFRPPGPRRSRSSSDAVLLEIGSRQPDEDEVEYSDIDLKIVRSRAGYTKKNGTPYPG